MEYYGDGVEQMAWFRQHTNADQLVKNMTADERDSFKAWTVGYLMGGQQYAGWNNMTPFYRSVTRNLDRVIDQATLDAGLTVVRRSTAELLFGAGQTTGTLADYQAQKGQIINCPANLSTGAAAEGLRIHASDKEVEYKIRIPAGSKGAGMWITDYKINNWGVRQREFIMSRDVRYRVGNTTYDRDRGVYVVELEYLGKLTHDYGR